MDPADATILLVDDDSTLLFALDAILRRAGYTTIVASDPVAALEKSREFTGPIHLLLTDVIMPEMNGPALARQILDERPHTRVLLMSAWNKVPHQLPFLPKPFRKEELLQQVAAVLSAPPPGSADISVWEDHLDIERLSAGVEEIRGQSS
jgi:two-component system, cell cycle sensor histidine kinase and response regulator CckA